MILSCIFNYFDIKKHYKILCEKLDIKNPPTLLITIIPEGDYIASCDPITNTIHINLIKLAYPQTLSVGMCRTVLTPYNTGLFVIAHEMKHQKQFENRELIFCKDVVYFKGEKFDIFLIKYMEMTKYSELPWEVDANKFAIEYMNGEI